MLIVGATVAQFILGAVWYSPLLFGNVWMRIMGVAGLTKEELQHMQKTMAPFYALQFALTLFMTFSFANFMAFATSLGIYHAAFWIWIGFLVPVQVSAVIWGSTPKKFWLWQCIIMTAGQLTTVMLMAFILSL